MSACQLWLLEHKGPAYHDEVQQFVVAAPTAAEARKLAATEPGDEGAAMWMDAGRTSCKRIDAGDNPRIVVRHFRPG